MIKDDTRQTIKFIELLIIILLLVYFSIIAIFYKAGNPERSEMHELNKIALQKTPITHIEKSYHTNRGVNSYALEGVTKSRKRYYFVYLPGRKKGYLLPTSKGITEAAIRSKFTSNESQEQVLKINLGWYHKRAVWEITSKNKVGDYNYYLYDFKNGNLIG
ncbi:MULTISPECIES: hypothetical protein [unclassified Lactobacillus]|uniref:hypothetical protein n=1 Tax=unclassified Lactobacillus TaxID=2620435 RepID=UPI000EFC86D9|nr:MULTISPECIES: hypothetical protein [unclassified Lactobacillus]RMC24640.1 hypothetical protein F5ESL0247_03875 [Lactobacillus sp. ESL0247]RMC28912.1 hypothetical protein F5ESL0246_03875 [Lactobacillus sp. ESL0246]RMC32157.1 hypothetical protein F5ESL0245_03880 [Lactobacillus sp. ESL0245]RMC48802.1 hypothetical protein F5ESL0228_04170 [Lactobacillus sp. ESL0228]